MSSLVFISFICPVALLLICGCIHFINHLEIKFQQNKKPHVYVTPNNSRRNSHINQTPGHLDPSTNHSINRSKLHLPHILHLSEIPSFSPSFKQKSRTKQLSKQLKQCITKLMFLHPKDTDWNFYPISFLFYILFLLILTVIIASKYHNYTYQIINNSCSNHSYINIGQTVTDWIIVYCLIILNLWESLLNFYRYWTTKECSMLRVSDSKSLYLYYFLYLLSFSILCILQFHLIYAIFPIIILYHFLYNLFCVVQFTRILIRQYNVFSNPDRQAMSIVNDNMLSSVKIMGCISFISLTLNSILLSLIVGCYNINLVCYLPLIYSISSFTFSFNFVRNRVFLTHFLITIKQIPMKFKNKNENKTKDIQSDEDIAMSPSCVDTDINDIQTPKKPEKLNRLTLEHMTNITSAPSSSLNEDVLENNNSNTIQQIEKIQTAITQTKTVSKSKSRTTSKSTAENKFQISVPPINANKCTPEMQSNTITPKRTRVQLQPTHKVIYPLTPLLNSSNNKRFIDAYRNHSRSEPSSPLITTNKKQKHINNFQFAKTPQMKARFSQSPVINWAKSLKNALRAKSLDDENRYNFVGAQENKISKKSKHKRETKSEGLTLPQLSQCITHSTSLEEKNDTDLTNALLNVFGEKPVLSPKPKKALEILGIDSAQNEMKTNDESVNKMDVNDNGKNEFIYLDNEVVVDDLEIVNDTFSLNNTPNNRENKELLSFETWNAFNEVFPSDELKLEKAMSEQKVEVYSGSKRNSIRKTCMRRSSLLDRDDMLKAVQLELDIGDIKEGDEDENMNENEYELNQSVILNDKENKLESLGGKRKSIREDSEMVAMMRLMVQHGFYSKKSLNSMEQLRKYNSGK